MFSLFSNNQTKLTRIEKVLLESIHFIETLLAYSAHQSTDNLLRLRDVNHTLTELLKAPHDPKEPLFLPSVVEKIYKLLPFKGIVQGVGACFSTGLMLSYQFGVLSSALAMLTLNPFTPLIMLATGVSVGSNLTGVVACAMLDELLDQLGDYLKQCKFASNVPIECDLSEMKQRKPM